MNTVINDKKGCRFVLDAEGHEVYVLYAEDRETIELYSTYTPPQLRGRGLAGKVVRAAFEYAKSNNLKVIPGCWYVRRFLEKNPGYKHLAG